MKYMLALLLAAVQLIAMCEVTYQYRERRFAILTWWRAHWTLVVGAVFIALFIASFYSSHQ